MLIRGSVIAAVSGLSLVAHAGGPSGLGNDLQAGTRLVLEIEFDREATLQQRHAATATASDVIRRRLAVLATGKAEISHDGENRIVVELPGDADLPRIKGMITRTAQLTFQLVDETVSLDDARRALPHGDEILPTAAKGAEPRSLVVQSQVGISGEDLAEVRATFQFDRPVVAFKLNAVGAQRFAELTRANVGKRFAIVLDHVVVTAPVIRSPIAGGSGIIEGGFTAQAAADLALLLRAGALPGPIRIVEEQTTGSDRPQPRDP